jgi:hypothetical protein
MAMDLMAGRGSKKSGLKSPVSDTVKAGKKMALMPKRKMKGKR